MRTVALFPLVVVILLPLFVSCSALRSGAPVKASFSLDDPDFKTNDFKSAAEAGSGPPAPSWAARYIPGWKWISDAIPPPTDARIKWDERYNRNRGSLEGHFPEDSL